jgi:hypothetical protein
MKARLALLLALWLIGTAAWSQPRPAGAARVDSREECAALGGKWQARGSWQAACEVGWDRGECLRLGGAWTEINKAAAGGRCFAPVSEFAVAQQCLDQGGIWGPSGSRTPDCTFEPRKEARTVTARAPDADKRCDSQKDCTYGCVYHGPPVARGADVLGRCRATNEFSGCSSMVESGRLVGSICTK